MFDVNTTTRIYGNPTSYLIFSFPINLMSFRFLWAFSIRSTSIFKLSFLLFLCISFHFLYFFFYPGYHHLLLLFFDFYQPPIDSIDRWCNVRIHLDFFLLSLSVSLFCLVLRLSPLSCISCSCYYETSVSQFCFLFWFFFSFSHSLTQLLFHPHFMIYILLFCTPPEKKYNVL